MNDKEWVRFIKEQNYQISKEALMDFLTQERPKKVRIVRLCDEDFIKELRKLYLHIDIDEQISKMRAWLLTKPERKFTRQFVVNWLNKQPKTLHTSYDKIKELLKK